MRREAELPGRFQGAAGRVSSHASWGSEADVREEGGVEVIGAGRYRHYKGGVYIVLGVARHSETEEEFVVYHPEGRSENLWVRPLAMWLEEVETGAGPRPRFVCLGQERLQ
jgi:hypothetical protein